MDQISNIPNVAWLFCESCGIFSIAKFAGTSFFRCTKCKLKVDVGENIEGRFPGIKTENNKKEKKVMQTKINEPSAKCIYCESKDLSTDHVTIECECCNKKWPVQKCIKCESSNIVIHHNFNHVCYNCGVIYTVELAKHGCRLEVIAIDLFKYDDCDIPE